MSDRIQRNASIFVSGLVVLLIGWMTWVQICDPQARVAPDRAPVIAAADAATDAGPEAGEPSTAAVDAAIETADEPDAGTLAPTESGELPKGAPRAVRVGVILVQYQGAEGAAEHARPRAAAQDLAARLADEAKSDFKAAVARGDSGSSDDVGRIPRGVLDPIIEGAVFRMAVGEVSGVLETPRGYWIVKRVE